MATTENDHSTARHFDSAQSPSSISLNGDSDTSISSDSELQQNGNNMVSLQETFGELYEDNVTAKILKTAQDGLVENVSELPSR